MFERGNAGFRKVDDFHLHGQFPRRIGNNKTRTPELPCSKRFV
jgi:hypothetical protein